MKNLIKAFIISGLLINTMSCKKDHNSNSGCSLSEANFEGTYKYGTVTYKATPTSTAQNADSVVDSCSRDDIVKFAANHVLIYIDAGIKCNPSGDGTGTWSLHGNVLSAGTQSGTIKNFSCSGFTASHPDFFTVGDTLLIWFQKQ